MIRIKTIAPYASFYIVICEDGVQVLHQHYGSVDARVRAPAATLAWYLFGLPESEASPGDDRIMIVGDRELIESLSDLAKDLNIWLSVQGILKEWMPHYDSVEEIWQSLKSQDPIWVERMQYLPQVVNDAVIHLRRHSDMQKERLDEMKTLLLKFERRQRLTTRVVVGGLVVLIVVAISAVKYMHFPWLQEEPIQAAFYGTVGLFGMVVSQKRGSIQSSDIVRS